MANNKNVNKIEITDLTPDGKKMYLIKNAKIFSSKDNVSYYNISNLIDYALMDENDALLIIVKAFVENDIEGNTAGLEYHVPLGSVLDDDHVYYLKVIIKGVLNDIFKNRVLDDISVRDKVKTQINQVQFTVAEHNTRGKEVVTEALHFTNVAKRLYRLSYADYELYYLLDGENKDYYLDDEHFDEEGAYKKSNDINQEMIDQLAENVNEGLNKDILKKD